MHYAKGNVKKVSISASMCKINKPWKISLNPQMTGNNKFIRKVMGTLLEWLKYSKKWYYTYTILIIENNDSN